MPKTFTYFLLFCLMLSCSTVPITERKRVNIVEDSEILPASFTQYDSFLKEHKLSTNKEKTKEIQEIGRSNFGVELIQLITVHGIGNDDFDTVLLAQPSFVKRLLHSICGTE